MVETQYTFSISGDTALGIVNSDSLTSEIGASAIVEPLTRIETLSDVLDVYFANALSGGDQTILNGVVAAHTGVTPENQLALSVGIPRDPIATDDVTAGYQIRDRWLNSSTEEEFVCTDNTGSAAVWKRITALGLATDTAIADLQNAINSGIDLADHSARHIQGGGDEIDGDQLDIDFTPTNYTPTTAPPEVTDVNHLSAHLAGIDVLLAGTGNPIEVQDDDVQVITNLVTLNFGDNFAVTDDTGGKVTIDTANLVPDTRQIIAGDGLTGGGDLTTDRTLNVVANADGSIVVNANDVQVGVLASDAQHGNRGGGSLHAVATGATAGFLSATDKTKLDGIESGATADQIASEVPFTPDGDVASTNVQAAIVEVRDDTDTKLAGKADTVHAATHIQGGSDEIDGDQLDIDFTPTNYTPNTTPPEVTDLDHLSAHLSGLDTALGSVGGNVEVQDNDVQVVAAATIINFGTRLDVTDDTGGKVTIDADVSDLVADTRQVIAGAGLTGGGDLTADRTFDVVANADGSIVVNANDIQVGVLASDAQHGNRGGGSLHAEATTLVAGFLSAADKTKLDGIQAGAEVNAVDSVFGRTGAVVASASDYDAIQIDFTPDGDITSTNVQAAIVEVRDDTDTKLAGKADVTHAATHIQGGSDEIDGDQLDIDFTPSNYTPNTNPPEATDLDHLSAHLSGIDDALSSVGGSIDVEDDTTPVAGGINTLNFGDSLTVTDDGGGQVTIDGENAGRAVFVIWAEENAGLNNNTYEWAFGNGDDTPSGSGIPVPIDCVLFAIGLDHNANASATVAVEADGVQIGTVTTSNERNTLNTLVTPVNVSQGQVIGFETISGPGDGGGNRVSAYFRTTPFGAGSPVDSVFGRTGAVSAQASDYDANQIDFTPNGDITSTDTQAAIVEVRDDTDNKLASKANTSTQIIAGSGLTGGGDLSTDRTLNVIANADGSIVVNANDIQVGEVSDAQHGNRGGGTLHAVATTSVAGFLSAADKTKLDNVESGATADQNASEVPFTPSGDITSADVQAAIVEVRDDTDTKLASKADVTHAATHIQGGSDEVDGDQLDIDFTPSNYTPSTSPSEVTDVDHLSAHLAGIDDALEGADLPALQLRLNADVAATGGFTDIEWPVIDIENEPGTIERDDTNTERIVFKATGLYVVTYNLHCLFGGSDSLTAKAVLNNTTDVPGSSSFVETGVFTSGNFLISETFIVDIQSVNDYITIQTSEVGDITIEQISTVVVRRLRGAKGDKGDPGAGTTITVQEEGSNVSTSIDTLNFIGADITATDAGGGVANITVVSSGGADGDAFSAYDSAGTQSSTGTLQINIDTEQFPSSANYSLAADTVTVVAAGRYILSYQCTLVATGGGRSQVRTFLEVNTVELQGSSASLYLRQNDYGATGSASLVVDLPANAQITLNSTVTAGGPTYSPLVNGSHITLVRLT